MLTPELGNALLAATKRVLAACEEASTIRPEQLAVGVALELLNDEPTPLVELCHKLPEPPKDLMNAITELWTPAVDAACSPQPPTSIEALTRAVARELLTSQAAPPADATPLSDQPLTHGPTLELEGSSARIWARGSAAGSMRVRCWRVGVPTKVHTATAKLDHAHDYTGRATLTTLAPNARHVYLVETASGAARFGAFCTPPAADQLSACSFVFGTCPQAHITVPSLSHAVGTRRGAL
jgi:hypothetical protein